MEKGWGCGGGVSIISRTLDAWAKARDELERN
jgi:hypothetical protein